MTHQEIQGKLAQIEMSSRQLIEMMNASSTELLRQSGVIFALTQGNTNSGPVAAQRVQIAAKKLSDAAKSLNEMCQGIDQYVNIVRNV